MDFFCGILGSQAVTSAIGRKMEMRMIPIAGISQLGI